MDCCAHNQGINVYFNEAQARQEVARYLKDGLDKHALVVAEAVSAQGVADATVLEVGGGIGGLQVELIKRGAVHAISVEASSAYLAAAQSLADQLGLRDRVTYHHADFTCNVETVPAADVVVLHRVVCCYPDMPRLVTAAAQHARRVMALSFPRDAWYVHLYIEAQARWLRLKGSRFRNYLCALARSDRACGRRIGPEAGTATFLRHLADGSA